MNDFKFTLYVRLGCHLCEDVAAILTKLNLTVKRVNIDCDPALKEEYNWSVPVIHSHLTNQELSYPFTEQEILHFFDKNAQ